MKFKRFSIKKKVLAFTGNSWSLMLTQDDEFISVDLKKVFNVLLTDSSENLFVLRVNTVGSLTRRAKLAVTMEMVMADVKLGARVGELAGAVLTISLVVMLADLEGCTYLFDPSFRNVHLFLHSIKRL